MGPDACEAYTAEQAAAYVRELATSHYENFTVVSRLLPVDLRDHFAAVYAFCRWADDLGDEVGDRERSLELLAWWRAELQRCYAGEPRHPVFIALEPTVRRFDIPIELFDKLIQAFEQDQRVHRYETWEQVVDYCTRSADPVGRLVLYMGGYRDEARQRLADATCTALQLANFWQDVRRDILERERIYVPAEALARRGLNHEMLVGHARGERRLNEEQARGYRETIREMVDRTWPLFAKGRGLWPLIRRDLRLSVRLFTLGGETVLRRIERIGHDTLERRPVVGGRTKLSLMARGLAGHWADRRGPREPGPALGPTTGKHVTA